MNKKLFLFAPALFAAFAVGCKNNENTKNVITDAKALSSFVADVNGGKTFEGEEITLKNDIEFTDEWTPIGTKDHRFLGKFNGNGHKLTIKSTNEGAEGLELVDPDDPTKGTETVMGLFGYAGKGSEITNLTVNADFSQSKAYIVGGVYGSSSSVNDGGSIKINNVTIDGKFNSKKYSGGLIAQAQGYNVLGVSNVKVNAEVKSEGYRAGGLFGCLSGLTLTGEETEPDLNKGTFDNCEFTGSLDATPKSSGDLWIGGFAGQVGAGAEFKVSDFKMTGSATKPVVTTHTSYTPILFAQEKTTSASAKYGLNSAISLYFKESPVVGSFSSSYVACSEEVQTNNKANYAIELSDNYFEYKYNHDWELVSATARAILDAKAFDATAESQDIEWNGGEKFDATKYANKSFLMKKDGSPYFGGFKV